MWEFTGDYYTATRAPAKPDGAAPLPLAALLANERADKGCERYAVLCPQSCLRKLCITTSLASTGNLDAASAFCR